MLITSNQSQALVCPLNMSTQTAHTPVRSPTPSSANISVNTGCMATCPLSLPHKGQSVTQSAQPSPESHPFFLSSFLHPPVPFHLATLYPNWNLSLVFPFGKVLTGSLCTCGSNSWWQSGSFLAFPGSPVTKTHTVPSSLGAFLAASE